MVLAEKTADEAVDIVEAALEKTVEVAEAAPILAALAKNEAVARGKTVTRRESTPTGTPELAMNGITALDDASEEVPAVLPSLIAPADVSEPIEVPEEVITEVAQDIRSVSGTRVNVRGGPGTEYAVVASLIQGDQVEVIDDTGEGWVLLRLPDGESVGWVADFLLTGG